VVGGILVGWRDAQRQRPTPEGAVVSIELSSAIVDCFLGLGVAADRSIRTPASETDRSAP
jgi:hypothetical protein